LLSHPRRSGGVGITVSTALDCKSHHSFALIEFMGFFVLFVFVVGLAVYGVSGWLYRRSVRIGMVHSTGVQVFNFIASFIVISVVLGAVVVCIFLSTFRFQR
jgi:hypothetical protein